MPKLKNAPPVAGKKKWEPPKQKVGNPVTLSIEQIGRSKTNYRQHLDEKADADLAASIAEHGILQPLIVRDTGTNKMYEIVAGHRRYEAAKMAGLLEVPVVRFTGTADEAAEIQLVENLQRSDVHPIDEAAGFAALVRKKYALDDIAMKVAKPRSYIAQRLQLLKLDAKVQAAFLKGSIELGHAFELCRLQPADQKKAFDACFDRYMNEGSKPILLSVQQFRGWISQNLFLDLSKAPWNVTDETLVPKAGSCLICPKRTGNQSDLFDPGTVKGSICTDAACFAVKRRAFVDRTIAEHEKKGTPLLKLAEEYKPRSSDLMGTQSYRELQPEYEDCPDTKLGIMVEAYRDRLGEIKRICTAHRCPVHGGYVAPTQGQKTTNRNAKRQQELDRATRKTVLLAVMQSVHATPTRKDLELFADSLLLNLHQDCRVIACSLFGWVDELRAEFDAGQAKHKPKKGDLRPRFSPDLMTHAKLRLKTMTDEQLCRFVAACSLAQDLSGSRWYDSEQDALLEAAEVRGIDTKEIARQVKKDFDAKWREDDVKKMVKKPKSKKGGTKKSAGAKMSAGSKEG